MQKVNERIAEVRELISSQEKLIQSAHGLLKVTTDADKRALLAASVESREKNLEKLHKELQSLHGECVCVRWSWAEVVGKDKQRVDEALASSFSFY